MTSTDEFEKRRCNRNLIRSFAGEDKPVPTLAEANELGRAFTEELATRASAAVNSAISAGATAKFEDLKDHIVAIQRCLDRLGLAIRCPNTGLRARLLAETSTRNGNGLLSIVIEPTPGVRTRSVSRSTFPFPQVTLMSSHAHQKKCHPDGERGLLRFTDREKRREPREKSDDEAIHHPAIPRSVTTPESGQSR